MAITVLTPEDLEKIFDSNPEQFTGYQLPTFVLRKVRTVGNYRVLYIVDAMVPYQIDPAHAYVTGIYEKVHLGIVSKAGLDYIRACYPRQVFIDNKLHS